MIRSELGDTVEEMARRCGIKAATYSSWERGAHPRDFITAVSRIAAATGYDRDWLTFGGPLAPGDGDDGVPFPRSGEDADVVSLVPAAGFEPAAFCSGGRRSIP